MNVFSYLPNNTLSRSELSNEAGTVYNIHYGDILLKLAEYTNISETHLPSIKRSLIVKQYARNSLQDGDIVIADTAEDITAGRCIEIGNIGGKVIVAGLHAIPCRPKIEFGQAFLGFYMNSNAFRIQLFPLMQGIKVISISKSAIKNVTIRYPFLHAEQECIGSLFRCLDSLIAAAERKVLLLKKKKHAYLNHIFTQHLRFTGHTTPWQTKKLGELEREQKIRLGRGKVISENDITSTPGKYPIYSSSARNNGEMGRYGLWMFNQELVTWSIDGGGSVFYRPKHRFSITNVCGFVQVLTNIDCPFLAYQMMYIHNKIHFDYTVKAHPSVIRKLYFLGVPSIEEQIKIGNFFQTLDSLITATERKVNLLKKKKQAYLQRMFI